MSSFGDFISSEGGQQAIGGVVSIVSGLVNRPRDGGSTVPRNNTLGTTGTSPQLDLGQWLKLPTLNTENQVKVDNNSMILVGGFAILLVLIFKMRK